MTTVPDAALPVRLDARALDDACTAYNDTPGDSVTQMEAAITAYLQSTASAGTTVRAHKHTCTNVQPGSTYADKCDCGALDTAGNAIPVFAHPPASVTAEAVAWVVTSRTGMHIGLWIDEHTAWQAAGGYQGSTVRPLYAHPPTSADEVKVKVLELLP